MQRSPPPKFVIAALVVSGAASFAIAQNAELTSERAAPLPLSALTASPVIADPEPVPVTATAAAAVPSTPPASTGTSPLPLQAAAIDPIVEPVKRAPPTVENIKAAASGKPIATVKVAKTEAVAKKPATKVAAWKQKADVAVKDVPKKPDAASKNKVASAKPGKPKTAKN